MVDTTDSEHGDIYIPHTFILDGERKIYKVYNGWWFLGRPTVEDLRIDLREVIIQLMIGSIKVTKWKENRN